MSVDDFWKSMGVKHEDDCPVCSPILPPEARRGPVLASGWFWWGLVILLLVAAYVAASHFMYDIVGGLQ